MPNLTKITPFDAKIITSQILSQTKSWNTFFISFDHINSVTRFGEIPPLWPIFKNLWYNLYAFGANFHWWKWPNIENTIWSSDHTVCKLTSEKLFIWLKLKPLSRFNLNTIQYKYQTLLTFTNLTCYIQYPYLFYPIQIESGQ